MLSSPTTLGKIEMSKDLGRGVGSGEIISNLWLLKKKEINIIQLNNTTMIFLVSFEAWAKFALQ